MINKNLPKNPDNDIKISIFNRILDANKELKDNFTISIDENDNSLFVFASNKNPEASRSGSFKQVLNFLFDLNPELKGMVLEDEEKDFNQHIYEWLEMAREYIPEIAFKGSSSREETGYLLNGEKYSAEEIALVLKKIIKLFNKGR